MSGSTHRTQSWIASRSIVAVRQSGEEIVVTLRIGTPYQISPEQWACPAAIDGLLDRLPDVHGVDTWQSIQLVQSLQARLLGYFLKEGGTLVWPETREPMELRELFPSVGEA